MRAGAVVPGLLIAAARSGSGKTVLTLGLMRALGRRGLRVAGRKNGPDYIDPAFHAAVTGRPSYNLDSWAMPADLLRGLAWGRSHRNRPRPLRRLDGAFRRRAGRDGAGRILRRYRGPDGLARGAGARLLRPVAIGRRLADGLRGLRPPDPHRRRDPQSPRQRTTPAAGVRCRRASGTHGFRAVPRSDSLVLPERHLGLVQAGETGDLEARVEAAADVVAEYVDLDALIAAAAVVPGLSGPGLSGPAPAALSAPPVRTPGRRIAVARDAAFSFLYPHVLEGWRRAGAEVAWFSPLDDEPPPEDCDACWLPGGYPELHAARIANATIFMDGLRAFAKERPVHGECGGYMVLGRSLVDAAGGVYPMAGLLDVETSFARRKLHLGYRLATILADGPLGPAGTRLSGHEFHYATITSNGQDPAFASVVDAYGAPPSPSGSRHGNVTGSFFHVLSGR